MRRAAVIGLLLVTWCLPYAASAQRDELYVTPETVDSSEPVTRGLQSNKGSTSTKLEGSGGRELRITYGSTDVLEIFLVPLQPDGSYVPTDFLRFTLPAAGERVAVVDLTVSPGWSPGVKTYLVHILTATQDVRAGFYKVEFTPASVLSGIIAAAKHLFTPESYAPNSYHALRGYRVLAQPVTIWFGVLAMLAAGAAFARRRSEHGVRLAVYVLCAGMLVYGARWTLDLARFTHQHLGEYYGSAGVYDEAGAMHALGAVLKMRGPETSVYFCRDGTNFREKILRYAAYPVPVSDSAEAALNADSIVVSGKIDWSFQNGLLTCGDAKTNAELTTTFFDGTQLFRRLPND